MLGKTLYGNNSVYDILHKTSVVPKLLCIRFDKIDGFTINLDGKIKHLILFDYGLFNKICDENKKAVLQIVLIIILSAINKNKINCYNIFLEKGLYKDKSDRQYFLMNV